MIIGPAYSVAECGEQLAWLAAALPSPSSGCVIYTTPLHAIAETHNGNHPAQRVLEDLKGGKPKGPTDIRDEVSQLTRFDIEVVESSVLGPHTRDEKTRSGLIGSVITPAFVQGFPQLAAQTTARELSSRLGPLSVWSAHWRLQSPMDLSVWTARGSAWSWLISKTIFFTGTSFWIPTSRRSVSITISLAAFRCLAWLSKPGLAS